MSSATTAAASLLSAEWWDEEDDELAHTLETVFAVVRDENEWRTDKDEYHWGLYEGTGLGGVRIRSRRNMTYSSATLPDNVCKMAVDTLTAKVATIRPIPQVMTSRANWKDQRRARKMRQFIEGAFFNCKIHEELSPRIIKDALVARAGVVQVHADGKKLRVERLEPWTVYFDEWDAEFGLENCGSAYRIKTMDRRRAMQKFGKSAALKEKIKNAGRLSSIASVWRDEERWSTVERVELLEAWHRCPNHPEKGDKDEDGKKHDCHGRHVIICQGAVLFAEEWPHDYFPLAILTYDTPNTGVWGSPLVQTLEGYQVSINKANDKLDEMYDVSGKYVILRDGGGIVETEIINGLRVLHSRGAAYDPVVFDADLVNEHMRARAPDLVQRGLSATGISSMSAQSQKPAEITSGIALQTLDDIESQRHIVFGRRFETWCMNVARLLIEATKQIADKYGDLEVQVPMRGAYLPLKWSDVRIDGFKLSMQSVGQLYMSFAGRLDKLKTLFEMGAIDRGTFMRQLDAGDLQAELDLETADRLIVDEMIESMLDSDPDKPVEANDNADYVAPTGYLPLDWAHRRAHQKRLQAEMEGAPEHVLDLLGRFIDDLEYLQAKADADAKEKAAQAAAAAQPLAGTAMTTNLAAQPGAPSPMPAGPTAGAAPMAA